MFSAGVFFFFPCFLFLKKPPLESRLQRIKLGTASKEQECGRFLDGLLRASERELKPKEREGEEEAEESKLRGTNLYSNHSSLKAFCL